MDIEINIGREAEGANVVTIVPKYKRVGRNHAVVHWHDGIVTIEDKESSNGIFVNGRRVAKKKLKEDDTVWLGGNGDSDECCQLDLKEIYDFCRKKEKEIRTDFSAEFEDMKQAYMEYQKELANLNKRAELPERIIFSLPAIIGAVLFVVMKKDMTTRMTVVIVGGALTTMFNLFVTAKKGKKKEIFDLKKTELQLKYQPRYCCPKCGKEFPLTTHWTKLEAGGKCTNPKCNAIFVKTDKQSNR